MYSQKTHLALGSMRYDIEDTGGIDRLFKLIEQRAGHWLAMEIEETKIELTHAEQRHVPLDRIEPGLSVELSRALFESAIDNLLERIRNSVTQLLGDAGVGVAQVDRHGVLHRRFKRHSGTAPERLGDVAQCPACGRQYLRQHRQRPGDRSEEALRLTLPGPRIKHGPL